MLRLPFRSHPTVVGTLRLGRALPTGRALPVFPALPALPVALAFLVALALTGPAAALATPSGIAIRIGTPSVSGPPSVAVDGSGTAYIAYANRSDAGGGSDFVQYCVLAAGARRCAHAAALALAAPATGIDGVDVLVDGGTVVILADVYGGTGSPQAADVEPEQEWQSTDGGATFTIVNGGRSVTEGNLSADTAPLGAVIVPGTDVLGYGWYSAAGDHTVGAVPTFNAFALTSPPECSLATCPAGFALLQASAAIDPIGGLGGVLASQQGTDPGVLAVFNTLFTTGPLACGSGIGTGYAYASGAQSATNDYNVSPGSSGSAWKVAVSPADCDVAYPAVGGGPSGFGVLEVNEANQTTVYHAFDQAHMDFDTPMATVAPSAMIDPSLSQDGTGGIYATYLAGGAGGDASLSYSSDGGAQWEGPETLVPWGQSGIDDLTSSVGAGGQGWAAWVSSGSVFAQQFDAQDAAPSPTSIATRQVAGAAHGASITIDAGVRNERDTATLTGTHASTAGGTVTYSLYAGASCSASSKVHSGGTQPVSNGVVAPSAAITSALAPGIYDWEAVYSGDPRNGPATAACGAEQLEVSNLAAARTATSTGRTLTVTITCTSAPCPVTARISLAGATARDARSAAASTAKTAKAATTTKAAKTAKAATRAITLAGGTFTLHTRGSRRVTLTLTSAGRRLLSARHDRLPGATLTLSESLHGRPLTLTQALSITPGR